jgi:hypothetical protein
MDALHPDLLRIVWLDPGLRDDDDGPHEPPTGARALPCASRALRAATGGLIEAMYLRLEREGGGLALGGGGLERNGLALGDCLARFPRLATLRHLVLEADELALPSALPPRRSVERLTLRCVTVDHASLGAAAAAWPCVRSLAFNDCPTRPWMFLHLAAPDALDGLRGLGALRHVSLRLSRSHVDAACASLARLTQLASVEIETWTTTGAAALAGVARLGPDTLRALTVHDRGCGGRSSSSSSSSSGQDQDEDWLGPAVLACRRGLQRLERSALAPHELRSANMPTLLRCSALTHLSLAETVLEGTLLRSLLSALPLLRAATVSSVYFTASHSLQPHARRPQLELKLREAGLGALRRIETTVTARVRCNIVSIQGDDMDNTETSAPSEPSGPSEPSEPSEAAPLTIYASGRSLAALRQACGDPQVRRMLRGVRAMRLADMEVDTQDIQHLGAQCPAMTTLYIHPSCTLRPTSTQPQWPNMPPTLKTVYIGAPGAPNFANITCHYTIKANSDHYTSHAVNIYAMNDAWSTDVWNLRDPSFHLHKTATCSCALNF